MNYERGKKAVTIFLVTYALVGVGAHITSTSTEDAYPFFSWFLFVTVPPRVQSGFDIMFVSIEGKRLETPLPLLSRPDVFLSEGISGRDLSTISERLAHSITGRRNDQITAIRGEIETHFARQASYVVRAYSYDTLEYFKSGRIATSTVLAEFLVEK